MESTEEEVKSNGKMVKKSLGIVENLRGSIRRAAAKSPLSSIKKGTKKEETDSKCPPPSPSLSAGSPVLSPLRNIFNKKDDDKTDSPKNKGLSRSNTDPGVPGQSFLQRGAQIRRSLFGMKRERQLGSVSEGGPEEGPEEERGAEEEEEEERREEEQEMEEMYTLPELPHTPLSVMQINKLIENEVLEEAYLNLLSLRLEFQSELSESGDHAPMALSKKEKDLNLLYNELREKINTIVRDSNSLPARNKKLLEFVARIIQEEDRRASDPGALPGAWMDSWRSAVEEGVQAKVDRVQLDSKDQNGSWLAVHLGLLGKTVVEDLESVRRELRWAYPPSFRVFSQYLQSYHCVLGKHVKKLEKQTNEVKDIHALLNWILNRYKSESIMGHVSLQVDLTEESTDLLLEPGFIDQLKDKYCSRVKEDMRSSLNNIIKMEGEEFWRDLKEPEKEEGFEGFLISDLHMDIWTLVKGFVSQSRTLDLEQKVTCSCLHELTQFPKRFEQEYRSNCDVLRPKPLWSQYHVTYINSFSVLLEHMEGYRLCCSSEVEALNKEVKWFNVRLLQDLEDQFREDVKIPLRRMMTRKWLTTDEDFRELWRQTEALSQLCSVMKDPCSKDFASRLHLHVSREYLSQLMKNNYSCKNRKHERAANKIRAQWGGLMELFRNMESSQEWLYAAGGELCDIIGQRQTSEIKNHLKPIVEHYPDFGRKHLVAVLWFRGLVRGREHSQILHRLSDLRKTVPNPDKNQVLFRDMQVTTNTDCLSNLPWSCLSFITQ